MKKTFRKLFTGILAASITVGMATTAFAAGIGGSVANVNQPHKQDPVHYTDGRALNGVGVNEKERESLRAYFESLGIDKWDIDMIGCGGVINLKVGESVTVHTLQNDYALAVNDGVGEKKIRNFLGKNPDGLVGVENGELKKYDDTTYCQEAIITGQKEGTLILLYRTNPRPWSYYKFVIGSGVSAPAPKNETKKADTPAKAEEKPKAAATAVAGGLSHTVQPGDTFGKLALNYYGDMNYWPELYAANADAVAAIPDGQIYVGMSLIIPNNIGSGPIAPAAARAGETLYTVQAGDTYGTIALAHFGNMGRYAEIYNRNADRLQDINTLYEGQILVLPAK